MKKDFEHIFKKIKQEDKVFHHRKGTGKILNKATSQSLLMSYFHHKIVTK